MTTTKETTVSKPVEYTATRETNFRDVIMDEVVQVPATGQIVRVLNVMFDTRPGREGTVRLEGTDVSTGLPVTAIAGEWDRVAHMVPLVVGAPATIHLYTDTVAAVVVKVNPKSIVVRAVRTTCEIVTHPGGPYPVTESRGILDQPYGEPERYTRTARGFGKGSIRVTVGRSYSRTDYRH